MDDSSLPASTPPRLVLGVAAGIAAYKSAELARALIKQGAEVQVVMTESAKHFIGEATFQALTGRTVRSSLWDPQAEAAMGHIELARWPDAILIAPATADVLARLAQGCADDLLTTLCLASDRPLFVAPAMNRLMWAHAATKANLATLRNRGVRVIGPGNGAQACGEVGEGRMSEPQTIADEVLRQITPHASRLRRHTPLTDIKAVVTAGPTREPIDPVRFISNHSSGKQGYAVAAALAELGAEVKLISGPTALNAPAGVHLIKVHSAQQMLEATLTAMNDAQLLVAAAAVADYRVDQAAAQKIKKTGDTLTLNLVRNPDILTEVRARHPGKFLVGFAAETEKLAEHARDKLQRKKLDLIAANWVGEGRAFDTDDNTLQVHWADGERRLGPADKLSVARELARLIAERMTTVSVR